MASFKLVRINEVILRPLAENPWESRAVLNPGTVREQDYVHLLYRAVEGDNLSTIGYARLSVRGEILERRNSPLIIREGEIEKQGCEDPRIVPFEDTYYIFYTAYDGSCPEKGENVRVMMAETPDFQRVRKIGMVGPDQQDKDAMMFPEKINGKIAFMHRIAPNIQLAYFEDLDHLVEPQPQYWAEHLENLDRHTVMYPSSKWEAAKIGAGPPPYRTEAGWLLIYHGVDKDMTYRAGAALLDEKDPRKVLARLPYPILEPEREYEKTGDVNMVVFPEGLVQFDDEIQIYYGCADKVIGLASGKLSHLIDALWKHKLR